MAILRRWLPLVVVAETGNLRVKGFFNELNRTGMEEGARITAMARDGSDACWTGTITAIDWEGGSTGGDSDYYYGSDETSSSTRYPFWATLEDSTGLLIGQHVYLELGDASAPEGEVRVPDGFVNDINTAPWVWADNGNGRLEKRALVLSGSDDALGEVIVSDGLELTDYIAWPEEGLREGLRTIRTEGSVAVVTQKPDEEEPDAAFAG